MTSLKEFDMHGLKYLDAQFEACRRMEEAFVIEVRNHTAKQVREFVKQYNRGLSEGGHGGFRGHPEVIVR